MSALHGFLKWSFLGEAVSRSITPLVFLVLARLLVPEDFGIVVAATMVISFSQVFWEAGMNKAIIQFDEDLPVAASTAFWINLALGALVTVILLLAAEPIALHVFHDERVTLVLQVLSAQVLLSALASIHMAVFQRNMEFKRIFWVRFATVTAPGLISIPIAWYGMGYWALVAGTLVGQVVQVGVLWRSSSWSPGFVFSWTKARKLARFGGWVAATGLITWFYAWGDSLVVSIYLGGENLGLYRVGQQLISLTFGLVIGSAIPVVYSRLCEINRDNDGYERVFSETKRILRFVAITSVALGLILMLAIPLAEVFLGEQWAGIETVLSILVIGAIFSWAITPIAECYRAISKPHIETIIQAVTLPVFIAGYLIAIQYTFEAFLWTRIALMIFVGVPLKYLSFAIVQRRVLESGA